MYVRVFWKKAPRDVCMPYFHQRPQINHIQAIEKSTLHRGEMLAKFQLMVNLIAQLCEGRM